MRIFTEGTVKSIRLVRRSRNPSKFDMKNRRSVPLKIFGSHTGPPSVNPYWFHLNGSLGRVPANAYCLASSLSFRRNSNNAPCNWFVPGFVETLICVVARPNSAGKIPVWTLNSWRASIDGRTT